MGKTDRLPLDTGSLTLEEVNQVLRLTGMELTFIDSEDTYQYFTDIPDAVFPRTSDIIGTHVLDCHPESTHENVMQVIEQLRSGEKDEVPFKSSKDGNTYLGRYVAVRSTDGTYLGCMEILEHRPR